jgi:hypothetical protein
MELVKMKKPLTSLDFCYSGECENISVQEIFPAKIVKFHQVHAMLY